MTDNGHLLTEFTNTQTCSVLHFSIHISQLRYVKWHLDMTQSTRSLSTETQASQGQSAACTWVIWAAKTMPE